MPFPPSPSLGATVDAVGSTTPASPIPLKFALPKEFAQRYTDPVQEVLDRGTIMPEQQVNDLTLPRTGIEPAPTPDTAKAEYSSPKLAFVKPELVQQGRFTDVTCQFFGTFEP